MTTFVIAKFEERFESAPKIILHFWGSDNIFAYECNTNFHHLSSAKVLVIIDVIMLKCVTHKKISNNLQK